VILLSQNICDYLRYLSEITISDREKKEIITELEEAYKKHFRLLEDCGIGAICGEGCICIIGGICGIGGVLGKKVINPANLTAKFHYAIFVYEILEDKIRAIKILRRVHEAIVKNLDEINSKGYKSDYYIFERITDTITLWVLNSNYLEVESPNI